MNILEITFEKPSLFSGGGIGIYQSLKSALGCGTVDYIGPEFAEMPGLNGLRNKYYLEYDGSFQSKILSLVDGVTNGYYRSWKQIRKQINWEQYDVAFIEFSRYPFLVEECRRHKIPTLCRVHNIEKDYFHNLYLKERTYKRKLIEIQYSNAEKKSVRDVTLIALSDLDRNRLIELYGKERKSQIYVNPVCIEDRCPDLLTDADEFAKPVENQLRFLITGSLWYGPNADGTIWFIENVWKQLIEKYHIQDIELIIAGSKPNDRIKTLSNTVSSIKLVENPPVIDDYFLESDVYIAPIFSGAGMKVKIAEAMMFGLPILGTSHAFIGYEKTEAMVEINDEKGFIEAMSQFLYNKHDHMYHRKVQRNKYLSNYSLRSSIDFYKTIIQKVV